MTPRDAEKLLGGYATGTLSEAERRELFAAALEDQSLFDALADEEALRELLADPAARSRLLEVLAKPAPAPVVRPLWRRPAVMGLAASLLAAVGAGLLMKRTDLEPEAKPATPPSPQSPAQNQAAQKATKAAPAPGFVAAPPKPMPPPPPAEAAVALGARSREEAPKIEPAKPAEALDKTGPAPVQLQRQDQPSPTAGAGVSSGAAAGAIQGAPPAAAPASAEPTARAKQADRKAERKREAWGDTEAGVQAVGADALHDQSLYHGGSRVGREPIIPPPAWAMDRSAAPAFRLKVQWVPAGQLYLLRRDASGVSVLSPVTTSTLADGRKESLFTGEVPEGSALDLYLLPAAVARPETLPATGPVAGFRARVWPSASAEP